MKKLTALFLAMLLLLPALALAEPAPAFEPLDFGDFCMAIDPNMAYSGGEEKQEAAPWYTLYPCYTEENPDTSVNFIIVWSEEVVDYGEFTDDDADDYISVLQASIAEEYAAYGLTLSDFSVPQIGLRKIDGRDALVYTMVSELNSSITIYQMQAAVSDPAFGLYNFTGTALSMEDLNEYIVPLFDSITWNR